MQEESRILHRNLDDCVVGAITNIKLWQSVRMRKGLIISSQVNNDTVFVAGQL